MHIRPGRSDGNWQWRYPQGSISQDVHDHLGDITILFARYVPPTDKPLKGQGNI